MHTEYLDRSVHSFPVILFSFTSFWLGFVFASFYPWIGITDWIIHLWVFIGVIFARINWIMAHFYNGFFASIISAQQHPTPLKFQNEKFREKKVLKVCVDCWYILEILNARSWERNFKWWKYSYVSNWIPAQFPFAYLTSKICLYLRNATLW